MAMVSNAVILGFWWVCAIVSVVVVALRVWIICRAEASFRKHMRSLASLKDFFLVFTTATVIVVVGLVTNTVMLVEDTEGRLARDHPELPARQREQLMTTDEITAVVKWSYISYLMITVAQWMTKCTLSAMYLGAIRSMKGWMRVLVIATAAYLGSTFIVNLGVQIFYCGVPSNNWDMEPFITGSPDACWTSLQLAPYITYAVFSVTTDIALIVSGLFVIHGLRVDHIRQWVSIIFILTIGLVSMGASLGRCILMSRFIIWESKISKQLLYNIRSSCFWVSLETCAAVLACSLPTLRALLSQSGLSLTRHRGMSNARDKLFGGPEAGLVDLNGMEHIRQPGTNAPV